MNPHYPQPQQQAYYPPLQSRGFNTPPQQARHHPPIPQAQPPVSGYVQQHQVHPQYQQRPGQYYQQSQGFSSPPQQRQTGQHYAQTQGFTPPQQQRHAPASFATPQPPPVTPQVHPQGFYPPTRAQSYPSHVPFAAAPHPPANTNSQPPEAFRRPLPAPAAGMGQGMSPTMRSAAPVSSFTPPGPSHGPPSPQRTPHTHANPPASSFSGISASQSFPRGQSFPVSTQVQPPVQTPIHYTPPAHGRPSLPQSPTAINNTPPRSPTRTPDSPSKRPLPAPPGAGTAPSSSAPLARFGSVGPGVPAADSQVQGSSPAQRRALPFSPTQPPSVEAARNTGRSPIRLPQRSSTLPSPLTSQEDKATSFGSRDDTGQTSISRTGFINDKVPRPTEKSTASSHGFALPPSVQSKASASFTAPQQQQRPTQSLAFRIASLSLQEEQARTQPTDQFASGTSQAPAPGRTAVTSPPRSFVRPRVDLDDAPPGSSIQRSSFSSKSSSTIPPRPQNVFSTPIINAPEDESDEDEGPYPQISISKPPSISVSVPSIAISDSPSITVSAVPEINVSEVPVINVSEAPPNGSMEAPSITVSEATPKIAVSEFPEMSSSSIPEIIFADLEGTLDAPANAPAQKRKGLICYGCGNGILGRIVSAMGGRWHPACFKCTACSELLEHVSSYEHGGKPYCHLDYHEKFAPQCYHCRTPIIDERFITLDDPALGKRVYHEQHFFCAECGDPFLAPTLPTKQKDASTPGTVVQDDDVGFTVYKGHPYCEACHVRLRYPKCKRCKKSIRDGMQAVEALGGKWCWGCFLCAGCEKPFETPSFFQRDNKAFCEACFSVIIKSEL